jgi:hypothetical protein
MPTIILELTEDERRNLLEYLRRTNLMGGEAVTFVMLTQKIAQAKPKEVEKLPE